MEREQTLEMGIIHELEKCADKLRAVVEDIKTEVFREHKYE